MKNIRLFAMACVVVFATACKDNKKNTDNTVENDVEKTMDNMDHNDAMEKKLSVKLSPKSDSNVKGTVNFTEKDGKVIMVATMTGLSEGTHAIHIHEKADCSSEDGKSAGGHWNPTGQPHGKWGDPSGYHKGDIGNFDVGADGRGTISMSTDEWCIGCDDPNKNIVGKGIIVHEGADDYTSQPSGAAGSRVSCGGIIQ